MRQWVFGFDQNIDKCSDDLKSLLGGKGANLAEMTRIGLPVPPGFTLTTEACKEFYNQNQQLSAQMKEQVLKHLKIIENKLSRALGDESKPLLLSIRSGARNSMPGMMDTILNIGLNDATVKILVNNQGERFAYDSYRRLIQMYASVVLGISHNEFEFLLDIKKRVANVQSDKELNADHLKGLVQDYMKCIVRHNVEFPQDVMVQLWTTVEVVFKSWMNERAQKYRAIYNIKENVNFGTAVNIQAMVFGNLNDNSATGVCFTRNPSNGEDQLFGEYLINAQGEDVVAGLRTPEPILAKNGANALEVTMPESFAELKANSKLLEKHFADMQDIEFTIEDGKFWLLQTRSGKRAANAAIKIVVDMVHENIITEQEAILRVNPNVLDQLLHPLLDPKANNQVFVKGLPSSPGAASGKVVFSAKEAEKNGAKEKILLVRLETSPEDIGGMNAAQGILTVRGGMTSHAAVVARGMGKPCVTGAGKIQIDQVARSMKLGNVVINEGDVITINGSTGDVYIGEVNTIPPIQTAEFVEFMSWADKYRTLRVRANADTPQDVKTALGFGCEGIGLCRTEHMFFNPERLLYVRKMILSSTEKEMQLQLEKIIDFQRQDFIEIFNLMKGLPVTVRLLDPPLHEFLPISDKDISEFAQESGIKKDAIEVRLEMLKETNPMLGHRGCRLGITSPSIYKMQVQAIFEAWLETGSQVQLEIMVPLVLGAKELSIIKGYIEEIAAVISAKHGAPIHYMLGTMIELPRAALKAGEIAIDAEFFSFGTNDLTQSTMGISRDDSVKFLQSYFDNEIFECDPFATIDTEGVGELIEIAKERGQKTRSSLKLGVCSEHGGDPKSIKFFHKIGLNYISCSPYRVPIARFASAQAALT